MGIKTPGSPPSAQALLVSVFPDPGGGYPKHRLKTGHWGMLESCGKGWEGVSTSQPSAPLSGL